MHTAHWMKWFSIILASIWIWTVYATLGHSRGQLSNSEVLKPPQGAVGRWGFLSWTVPHQVAGRTAIGLGFTGPPLLTLIIFTTWQMPIQSWPSHTISGYSSKDQFAPNYPPAPTSAHSLCSDEVIYTGPWTDNRRSIRHVTHVQVNFSFFFLTE